MDVADPSYGCYCYFDDYYNYGFYGNQGIDTENGYNFLGNGPLVVRHTSSMTLGYTFASTAVGTQITSISPARGRVGATVSLAIFGRFNPYSTPTVSISGYGVTASDVSLLSSGEITANFNITSDAAAGNHSVTVTSSGFTSNSVNFFVQLPTSLRRDSLSDIIEITDDDVIDGQGVVRATDRCGAHRTLVYQLMDQESQPIAAVVELDENFADYQGPPNLNPGTIQTGITRYDGKTSDVIGVTTNWPSCPVAFSLSFNQGFEVQVGTRTYALTTTNSVAVSFDGQDWSISVSMTHP